MAITPLPIPRITAPNWGKQLNDAITSRYTDLLSRLSGKQSKTGFNVKDYGAVGNGVADDTDAFLDAIAAAKAAGGGTVQVPSGTFNLSGPLQFCSPDGTTVNLVGELGNGFPAAGTTLRATDASACLLWGDPEDETTNWGRAGINGNFHFDGNEIATLGVVQGVYGGAYGTFMNISVRRVDGDGWKAHGQNITYINCEASDSRGNGWTLDYGVQGCQFHNCHGVSNGAWNIQIRESLTAGGPIGFTPGQNAFYRCIFEQDGAGNSFSEPGQGALNVTAGSEIHFNDCSMISAHHTIKLNPNSVNPTNLIPTYIRLRDCNIAGDVVPGTSAIYLDYESGGNAQPVGGTNLGILIIEGGWVTGRIVNGSTSRIHARNMNEGNYPGYTYHTEGVGAWPALDETIDVSASHPNLTPLAVQGIAGQAVPLFTASDAAANVVAAIDQLGNVIARYGEAEHIQMGAVGGFAGILATEINLIRQAVNQWAMFGALSVSTPDANKTPLVGVGAGSQAAALFALFDSAANPMWSVDAAGVPQWHRPGNEQTTVGAAGAASALPATPTKYLKVKDSAGNTLVVPAYEDV